MPRKKKEKAVETPIKTPLYTVSVDLNGTKRTFSGATMIEALRQLETNNVRDLVFKTKLVLTISKGDKTATQMLSPLVFRRMASIDFIRRVFAGKFEILVQ